MAIFVLSVIGAAGTAATAWIGAPLAGVPIIDLFALLLAPFPTLVCYAVAALLLFAVSRLVLGWMVRHRPAGNWQRAALPS